MITYDNLWTTMKIKRITQYRLIRYYGISAGQIGRLKKNKYISTHTVEVLCGILNCSVGEVMEYRPDPQTDTGQSLLSNEDSESPKNECKKSVKK